MDGALAGQPGGRFGPFFVASADGLWGSAWLAEPGNGARWNGWRPAEQRAPGLLLLRLLGRKSMTTAPT